MISYKTYDEITSQVDNYYTGYINALGKGQKTIIWGATGICRALMSAFSNNLPDITIWDRDEQKLGSNINGFGITLPLLGGGMDCNTIFILALYREESLLECRRILEDQHFEHIIDGSKLLEQIRIRQVISDYHKYNEENDDEEFPINNDELLLVTGDLYSPAGQSFNNAYLNQDLWAAKKIFKRSPMCHYDIGSRVDGFITHLLSFGQKTILIDIRPLDTYGAKNVTFINQDATTLAGIENSSIESLSALCSLEHFGLGRYGDKVDPNAHLKAFANMQRVLKKGADLYISLPVMKKCHVEFNAHRLYAPRYVKNKFQDMKLVEFSYVDHNGLHEDADIDDFTERATGLFHFIKIN